MGFWNRLFARKTSDPSNIHQTRKPWFFRGKTVISEDTSMQVSAFNRGVIYISTQVAKLPWDVKDIENNKVQGPISNLLNLAPNDEMNAFMFKMFMVQQAIIHGNSYAEIERNTVGAPIALWPLRSQDMETMRTPDGRLVYRYSNENSPQVYLQPRDVYHLRNFHTKDGLVGMSLVAYAREVLGIQIAADEMASGIFHNSGIPSGILKHPAKLSDEAYERLKKSWAEQTGGKKTGSTSILEEGMTYEPINVDPDTLQFLQSRQFGVLEIARFLGVPPTKLFDITAATYSNVENANLEVATDTLDAWCTNMEIEADIKLLNNRFGGRYTDMDLYQIFRGDMKTRADYFKAMMSVAAITPNQIRELEGMPGYPQGDKYYVATNNYTPVDRMDEVIDAEIAGKTKPASPSPAPANNTDPRLQDAAIKFLTQK